MSVAMLKLDPSLNGDIISHMPPNIIENILSRLYNWVTLPELIFNFTLGNASRNRNDRIVKFIDDVLSLHRGPICKFELSGDLCILNTGYIDKWILCLSRNAIQELILWPHPWLIANDELPSCLYSCELLNHLQLSFCTLRRPPLFASFNFLKSLLLYKVLFVGFSFENLISRCPILEILKIEGFTSYNDFTIYAPKLKCLYFAVDFVPKKLPKTYYHMKSLDLNICFNDVHMVLMALCLSRSAPNLQELKINVIIYPNMHSTAISRIRDGPEFSLNQLRNVKINRFGGWRRQLEFVEFLLSITPVLEKMSIYGYKDPTITKGYPVYGARMLEVLMRFS
ncbi:hypothetical protein NE237_021794 [Protea cynaroides]|uniref:Uncharacterized protein n=1 Tax=Protea cynaroides TaxID=273540 RepID=A0A9Q0HDY8_9MAGN|nr:hypothetical protein NE237_021794 [Protea cynaroides]